MEVEGCNTVGQEIVNRRDRYSSDESRNEPLKTWNLLNGQKWKLGHSFERKC